MSGALSLAWDGDEFFRLMEGFAPIEGKIAVAVSGGADSVALALCVKQWARQEIIALIVDHGLRAESAAEAAQVQARLRQIGIVSEILVWEHAPVTGRVHEKAREARYRLLTEACRRHGAGALLTAHHSGDQAETILMRLAKGSGIDGLAGIAAESMRDGIRLLRPLLAVSKERLVAVCEAAGVAFVTDPSNGAEKYARGRLRRVLPLLEAEGLTVESLTGLGLRAREAKDALDFYTREFLSNSAQTEIGGSVCLDRSALRVAPRAIALRALAFCLRYIHDEDYPPEHTALAGLLKACVGGGDEPVRTLYGCIASITEDRVMLLREPAAACEVLPLSSGATVLWDKRWLVTADSAVQGGTIRALGNPPHAVIDALAPALRRQIPQGRVRASLPALWDGDAIRAIPSFDEKAGLRLVFRKQGFSI